MRTVTSALARPSVGMRNLFVFVEQRQRDWILSGDQLIGCQDDVL